MKQPVPFGSYKLLERISVGGMAEVFRAITARADEDYHHLVAIKRILPNIAEDDEFIRMFLDEAKLAAQLHHANIAQIEQIGQIEGIHYIVLEHIHGRDLKSVFERLRYRNEPMPVAQACIIAMKVCEGLDYAHNKHDQSGSELGLVHRDVSPQNVLVSFEGEVKLIDFGIAKATNKGGGTTQAGVLKGKLGYVSPEQVRGLPIDRRTDIFACGIVLYEMLTGERLFAGSSDFSTLEKVRNVEIDPPTVHNPKLPRELEQIVLKALALDPSNRYQHAIDLHDALQDLVYTTGAFCSRKDLASWMKSLFARDYDEESARFAAYYQATGQVARVPVHEASEPEPGAVNGSGRRAGASTIVAPAGPPAMAVVPPVSALRAVGASASAEPSPRRTLAMGSLAGTKPPPPPGRSQQMAVPAVQMAPSQAPTPAPSAAPSAADEEPTALSLGGGVAAAPAKLLLVPPMDAAGGSGQGSSSGGPAHRRGKAPRRTEPPASHHDTRQDVLADAGPDLDGRPPDEDMASWDDDEEVETQIYDNDFESAPVPRAEVRPAPSQSARVRPASQQPSGARASGGVPQPAAAAPSAPSRATSSRAAVEASRPVSSAPSRATSADAASLRAPGARSTQSVAAQMPRMESRPERAEPRPVAPARAVAVSGGEDSYDDVPVPPARAPRPDRSADRQADRQADRELLTSRAFGKSVGKRPNRSVLALSLGGAALVIGGVALALSMGGKRQGASAPVVAADDSTGFDLYVDPAGITRWRLDGELRTDRLPSRIRGIAPGVHAVVIEAPPGFMSQSQSVTVLAGQAQRVKIELPVMEITGVFQSDPPGATITLITEDERKPLGPSPATYKLDPRKQYSVLFDMPGYVSANRPITLSGLERESITVVLERAALGSEVDARPLPVAPPPSPPPATRPAPKDPAPARPVAAKVVPTKPAAPPAKPAAPVAKPATPPTKVKPPADDPDPAAANEGILLLSAKPPCEILIDGKPTGLVTPQREIILSVGSHRITLVNAEYSINETFTVDIRADVPAKLIKNFLTKE